MSMVSILLSGERVWLVIFNHVGGIVQFALDWGVSALGHIVVEVDPKWLGLNL